MKRKLEAAGYQVFEYDDNSLRKIYGAVEIRSAGVLFNSVTIKWTVNDRNSSYIGSIEEKLEVLKGSRNKSWGSAVNSHATYAMADIDKYLKLRK